MHCILAAAPSFTTAVPCLNQELAARPSHIAVKKCNIMEHMCFKLNPDNTIQNIALWCMMVKEFMQFSGVAPCLSCLSLLAQRAMGLWPCSWRPSCTHMQWVAVRLYSHCERCSQYQPTFSGVVITKIRPATQACCACMVTTRAQAAQQRRDGTVPESMPRARACGGAVKLDLQSSSRFRTRPCLTAVKGSKCKFKLR